MPVRVRRHSRAVPEWVGQRCVLDYRALVIECSFSSPRPRTIGVGTGSAACPSGWATLTSNTTVQSVHGCGLVIATRPRDARSATRSPSPIPATWDAARDGEPSLPACCLSGRASRRPSLLRPRRHRRGLAPPRTSPHPRPTRPDRARRQSIGNAAPRSHRPRRPRSCRTGSSRNAGGTGIPRRPHSDRQRWTLQDPAVGTDADPFRPRAIPSGPTSTSEVTAASTTTHTRI
mgnify:CR=1 FL=1